MQVFLGQNLVFLAVPKAGSTSYETALRPHASIEFRAPPDARHMTAARYRRRVAPFLEKTFGAHPETMAILREPLARLESWYRYRQAEGRRHSTRGLSFDAFVRAVLSDDPPPEARIGSQDAFVSDGHGRVLVRHLFALEDDAPTGAFLAERFGSPIRVPRRNASPPLSLGLEPHTLAAFRTARAAEVSLYQAVRDAGHLVSGD